MTAMDDTFSARLSRMRLLKRVMRGAVVVLLVSTSVWLVLGIVDGAPFGDFQGVPWKK
jgi:hypothetical protein